MLPSSYPSPQPLTLTGRHVSLMPVDPVGDAAELYRGSHEPDSVDRMWRYVAVGPFADPAAMTQWLTARKAVADGIPFTVRNPQGQPVGSVSVMRITPEHGVAELGFIWYEAAAQRTKVNTESVYLLLKYLFQELGYRRVEWKCDADNAPSRVAALRLGFQFEGIFRQHMVVKGLNRDTAWFAIVDHEWPAVAAAMEHWLYEDDRVSLAELRKLRVVENS